MKSYNNFLMLLAIVATIASCQKMDRPELGDFDEDVIANPTTPLRFYVNFDSTSESDKQVNIRFKDSISSYPSFFPDASLGVIPGVRGTAYKGNKEKNLTYVNANDFAESTSFTVAFWMKHDGAPAGDAEFFMSFPSSQGHWSNSGMLLILDHTGAGTTASLAVIKFMVTEVGNGDHWFELTGANRMPDILDNQWHHLAFVYDEATSEMKFYRDGQLWSTQTWAGHGAIEFDHTKFGAFYLGGKTTDWGKNFNGGLDQFRLYNTALSAADIAALFNNKL